MDKQHAIHAQARNLALRQLGTAAPDEEDVVMDNITEGARLAGATEQEIWECADTFAASPVSRRPREQPIGRAGG